MARKVDRTHPKGFAHFIMEAIDEVAPGRGAAVYWAAFNRFEAYAAQAQRRPSVPGIDVTTTVEEWSANG